MPTTASPRILIVDDEAGLLAMVKTTLETLGYRVIAVSSGLEALDILAKSRPEIDLLLTDWQMPLMSGAELVRKVQAGYHDLKIVVATGDIAGAEDLSAFTVQGVLQKPYTTDGVLKVLAEVFGSINDS